MNRGNATALVRRWLPWIAAALYLLLALPQLNLPGLHYDEAKEAGLNALEMLQRQNVQAFRAAGVQVGATFLPIMVQDYIGALNVYLALPFLAVLGDSVAALRLLAVVCGLATLLLTWRLGDELGELAGAARPWTGGVSALLLAVSPSFLFWSRQGIFVTNVVVTLAAATVWSAVRWRRSGRRGWLWLAAFLAGVGLWTKLLFVWVLGALLVTLAAAWAAERWAARRAGRASPAPTGRLLLWGVAALLFLLGLSPLILFNQQTGGTVQALFGNLGRSYYGVDNADFLANLGTRLGQVLTLLRGDHFWYLGGPFANPWAAALGAALTIAALATALTTLRRRGQARAGGVLALALLFVALLTAQSAFTVSDLFITHYAIVQPFVLLLPGLALEVLFMAGRAPAGRAWRIAAGLGVAALALWLAGDLRSDLRYHRALAESGGHASHSDAVQRLADWLEAEGAAQPLALDWGIDAPVRFLTENGVQPLEVFGYQQIAEPDEDFAARVEPFLDDPTRLYALHAADDTVFRGRREALEQLAARRGLAVEEVAAFNERSGRPVFVVLRVGAPAP